MKKNILLTLIALMCAIYTQAESTLIGCFYYNLDEENMTAELTASPKDDQYSGGYEDYMMPYLISYRGKKYRLTSIGDYAFSDCTDVMFITIPNGVTSIGESAFSRCGYNTNYLCQIKIPNSVTSIGESAFYWTSISSFPENVKSIGRGAFHKCRGLGLVRLSFGITCIEVGTFEDSSLSGIVIPSSVTSIKNSAFQNCRRLASVSIPNSVTSIGNSAFYGCTGLTSITIPNSVTSIESDVFGGCTGLTSITIPNSVTSIGSGAFYDCTGLTSVTIPNSVTSIGHHAFRGCTGLTSITIPNSVTSIGAHAFSACTGLTSITIPNGVTSMGSIDCTSLTSVIWNSKACQDFAYESTPFVRVYNKSYRYVYFDIRKQITSFVFGEEVDSIPDYLCDGMTNIEYIRTEATTPPVVGNHSLTNIPRNIPIYVPCGTKTAYQNAAGWNRFYNFIEPAPDYTINVQSANQEWGSATITNKATCDNYQVTIAATANPHYHFIQWGDGNTDNPRTLMLTQDTTCTAEFAEDEYIIRTIPNISEYGNVSGSGTYKYKAEVSLAAVANTQYHFLQWSDGNTDNPRTITVEKNETYTAIFVQDSCIITTKADYGRVTGGGKYEYGTMVKLLVQPNAHYHFTQWTDGNTDNPRTVIVTQDTILTAEFAINQYTIKTEAKHGTVSGGGRYDSGSSIMLTANPSNYYHFVQWNDGNTDNPRTIVVTQDTTFTAVFAPNRYTITASGEHGMVEGTGTYDYETKVSLKAVPDKHYHFVKWSDGNTDNPRTVWVYQDITLTAEFAINQYTITTYAQNGNVSGGGTYDYGNTATLTATADEHYHFTQWSDGNTDNPRTVAVEDNATYTAEFKPDSYTIIVSAGEHGNVNGGGTYDYGTTAILTATADAHYHFTQWSDGNTDNPRTITVEGDATYTAEFAIDQHTISATCDPQQGMVTGAGTYDYGTQVTLTAVSNKGYEFAQWSNGVTDNPYLLTATADLTLEAQFVPATAVDNVSADGTTPQKIVRDGQVYILRNGKTYTTTGIEVK